MTPETFLKEFAALAETEGGIKRLRRAVLRLAIRGGLTAQDPNEGDACGLLHEVAQLRGQLVAEKKASTFKPGKLRPQPFGAPPGWLWTTLGEATICRDGTRVPVSRAERSARPGKFDYYGASGVIDKIDDYLYDKPLLLIGEDGANLINRATPIAFIARGKYWVNNHAHVLDGVSEEYLQYLEVFVNAIDLRPYITGTAQPKMNQAKMNSIPVLLPPLPEQKRIVKKVDELMALCDELEAKQKQKRSTAVTLNKSALSAVVTAPTTAALKSAWTRVQDHFEVLYDCPENVQNLRQTILQLAVMGKLVKQDPNDEPAEKLLERIATERSRALSAGVPNKAEAAVQIRKQQLQSLPRGLAPLPRGWRWATLMQASLLVADCHNKTAPYAPHGIRLIRTTNIRHGRLNFQEPKFVSEATYERWSARCRPQPGDVLITREAPMGEACIIPEGVQLCMGQRMMLVRLVPDTVVPKYLLMTIMSPDLMARVQDKPVGATVKHLRVGGVETMLLPIPPLPEQKRILAEADALLAICDDLETKLNNRQEDGKRLLRAVVESLVA